MTALSILFRCDASFDIGTGHVMRCMTLAEALREHGASCCFVCRAHPGNLIDLIRQRGFAVCALPHESTWKTSETAPAHAAWLGADWQTDAEQTKAGIGETAIDWLVVDHYALDLRWEKLVRPSCHHLMVIDDLTDRQHDCDMLLDQNLGRSAVDYATLVPNRCTVLAGPRYALLRPEFAAHRAYSLARRTAPQLKHLLITMGGVDKGDATGKTLDVLRVSTLPNDCRISVVMGPYAPWLAQVRERAATMPWSTEVLVNVSDMARLMANSDLAIGAGGSTSWERCCLGLPSVMLVLADNQREVAHALQTEGAAESLGMVEALDERLPKILNLLCKENALDRVSKAAAAICDGMGTGYVVQHLDRTQA